jgi:hypothetical protein
VSSFAIPAQAGMMGMLTDEVLTISASNDAGQGSVTITQAMGTWMGDIYTWSLASPMDILAPNDDVIATIQEGTTLFYNVDPVVSIGFNVAAGASTTAFNISSGLLSFAAISPAYGQTSAGYTITDVNGDTATLTPLFGGGTAAYRADYNGFIPTGTAFATMLPSLTTGPGGTLSTNDEFPGPIGSGNFTAIAGAVTDISNGFSFQLTPFDLASGTGRFEIIPEPTTLLLLGLGAMAIVRRRN